MSTIIIQSAIAIDSIRAPEPIYWSSTSHIINVMAEILSELIAETGKYCELSQSIFNCKTIPKITIKKYLERFDLYGRCSQECFVLALIYLDRICEKNTNFFIMRLNIHR